MTNPIVEMSEWMRKTDDEISKLRQKYELLEKQIKELQNTSPLIQHIKKIEQALEEDEKKIEAREEIIKELSA